MSIAAFAVAIDLCAIAMWVGQCRQILSPAHQRLIPLIPKSDRQSVRTGVA